MRTSTIRILDPARMRAAYRLLQTAAFLSSIAAALAGCSWPISDENRSLEWRKYAFEQLKDNLKLPLESRVRDMPSFLMEPTRINDKAIGIDAADRYAVHRATAEDLALIGKYLALLPPVHQKVFKEKLLAIYFVDDFAGAGMTNWLLDREGRTYYYIIFNSAVLQRPLDDWLSYKDDSTFDKSAIIPTVRVRTQTDYKALMYGLLHEGAHVVDYEVGVTPHMDALHSKLSNRLQNSNAFSAPVWLDINHPIANLDIPHRMDLNVYGTFSQKPLIPRSELPTMFAQLSASPFCSFYGASTWNEHLADFLTYHHIETRLGGKVSVDMTEGDHVLHRYEPTRNETARGLEPALQVFYK